jgi:hypothetical protein
MLDYKQGTTAGFTTLPTKTMLSPLPTPIAGVFRIGNEFEVVIIINNSYTQ